MAKLVEAELRPLVMLMKSLHWRTNPLVFSGLVVAVTVTRLLEEGCVSRIPVLARVKQARFVSTECTYLHVKLLPDPSQGMEGDEVVISLSEVIGVETPTHSHTAYVDGFSDETRSLLQAHPTNMVKLMNPDDYCNELILSSLSRNPLGNFFAARCSNNLGMDISWSIQRMKEYFRIITSHPEFEGLIDPVIIDTKELLGRVFELLR
jgi:hypothetical protein